jgi:hypothetical protein
VAQMAECLLWEVLSSSPTPAKKKKKKKLDLSFNIFLKVKTPKAQANWTNI